MISKNDRLNLIKLRQLALFGALSVAEMIASNLVPIVATSKTEINEEKASVSPRFSDNILDDELDGVKSILTFDSVKTNRGETEENILLSDKEKNQIANDLQIYRFRQVAMPRFLLLTA